MQTTNITLNKLSEDLLLAVKMEQSFDILIDRLSEIDIDVLIGRLNSDNGKKAFWINIYNAFYLILKTHKNISKSIIYTSKEIAIASKKLSLDDIEHGILRKYRSKFSLGYFPKLFVSK